MIILNRLHIIPFRKKTITILIMMVSSSPNQSKHFSKEHATTEVMHLETSVYMNIQGRRQM